METTLAMPDANLLIPFIKTQDIEKERHLDYDWFQFTGTIDRQQLNNIPSVFNRLRAEITEKEFLFLKTSFIEMNLRVDCLNREMENILAVVEPKVKILKTRLKLLHELYAKINASNKDKISVKAVETTNEILAIQHELNNLQNHKRYNILSDHLARASTLSVDRLNENEIVRLVELGLLEEVKYPFSEIFTNIRHVYLEKAVHQKTYCYSPLGLAFMEACQER
ncbi:hypothetical protein G6M26_05695 [Agrobacterium tumefaciens]|nr:hypothetical protein [Agrobacterium tumefaciens]NTE18008.1 hypothetical protein [Agrobacterium tumefaciens]